MHAEPCPRCGWPAEETTLVSRHATGNGPLDYRRCVCGAWLVRLGGRLVGATRPGDGERLTSTMV